MDACSSVTSTSEGAVLVIFVCIYSKHRMNTLRAQNYGIPSEMLSKRMLSCFEARSLRKTCFFFYFT